MSIVSGATPLFALDIAAIDTETTGLEPDKSRIVEIAGILVDKGDLAEDQTFETLVDPGQKISPSSIEIHGITDKMVEGAPPVGDAISMLQDFVGARLVIGHAIGFDLAILENEARRAGVKWQKPRSLCVRTLAMIAAPNLANHSLDGVAQWLEVEIANRHRALGDAEAAARIFLGLVPKLAEKGIRTLGEAERACRTRSAERSAETNAGWTEPVGAPGSTPIATLTRSDTFAYRHTVDEVMSRELVILRDDTRLREAIKTMVERNISSVFVAADPTPGQRIDAYGILTERDAMRRVARTGAAALDEVTRAAASRPLHSIRANAFIYRAISRIDRLGIRHLAVRSDDGFLEGIVSVRDLLKFQGGAAVALDDAIEVAETSADLAAAWATLPAVAGALNTEGVDARVICRIVSEEIRSATRRAAILAEAAMEENGKGPAPAPFAVLVLGSGGRGESLLAPDQDNALVFDAPGKAGQPGGKIDKWFAAFATHMSQTLDDAGIPLCKGGVMAKTPEWRGSVETWRDRISEWVGKSRPEDLLNVDIFFDAVPVHGERALGDIMLRFAYAQGAESPAFAKLLGEALTAADPFTLLGGLRLEEGRIDLKKYGLFPIVALARALAIRHEIVRHSTRARLEDLLEITAGGGADLKALKEGHAAILAAMLAQQSRDIENGLPPTNKVDPKILTREQTDALKAALKRIKSVPILLKDLMFG